MTVHAYAAKSKGAKVEPFEYDPGDLGPDDVEIKVESCGICHSDLAMIDNDWGLSQYPLVPGHEVSGTVTAIGPQVQEIQVGQRVGLGWQSGNCGHCRPCHTGREQLCINDPQATIVHRHGGFADRVRCEERWAIPIPDGLDPRTVGPLLCGGTTVWSPLLHYNVRPGMQAAVVGIGGLGHMALQFLEAIGCEVTAITTSQDKAAEAASFGATDTLATKDADDLKHAAGRFDFILSTVSAALSWDAYIAALAPQGTLCICGVPDAPVQFPAFPLIDKERRVVGGRTGSPADTAALLQFCAAKEVGPKCEFFPMKEVNTALQHVRDGKARYRVVLTA